MPRKPIDHTKSCVYRLIYADVTRYVGSTTNFTTRKGKHKSDCNNEKAPNHDVKLYRFMRETGGWSDEWSMVLVEAYPNCKSTLELRKYERHHYDLLLPDLNMIKPYTSEEEKKQYYEDNKDDILEQRRQYYEENKDDILGKVTLYREGKKDELEEYNRQYYLNNKEEMDVKNKLYRKENREKLNDKARQIYKENKK